MSEETLPQEPVISLVVAMAENRAIGHGGDLPWRLHSDMRYFRKITMGKPVIMGRRTFKSLPRVLDGRLNIVLTATAASSPHRPSWPIVSRKGFKWRAPPRRGPAPRRS